METDNIERIIDNKSEDSNQDQIEDEKSINEEEEESEKAKEEAPQNREIIQKKEPQYKENKEEKENENENPNLNNQDNQNQEIIDPFSTTTYILKYKRSKEELKELAVETNLPKSENCLFMINLKIVKNDDLTDNQNIQNENKNDVAPPAGNFLVICCHEIAAIYFDEIYERIYTLEDLFNENIFFKVFDSIEEARNILDESIKNNEKNSKKVFINLKDKELKLHMKLSFFDKEKEIVFNIPKKILTDKDKNNLLPEFLKEIQEKMNHLKDENKKLKTQKIILGGNHGSDFLIETDIKKENDVKIGMIEENIDIKNKTSANIESKSVKKKVIKKKIKKKTGKEPQKKSVNSEENFF